MKRSILMVLALAFGLAASSWAQQGAAASSAIEPDALAALNHMGDYLRTLKAFQVKAAITTEAVMDDGQKVQFAWVTDLLAQKPNRLRVDISAGIVGDLTTGKQYRANRQPDFIRELIAAGGLVPYMQGRLRAASNPKGEGVHI